jgi:hypothetical protein
MLDADGATDNNEIEGIATKTKIKAGINVQIISNKGA